MRIGIDAHVLGKGIGGVERVVEQMTVWLPVLAPEHEFVIFVNRRAARARQVAPGRNVSVVTLAVAHPLIERSLVLPWLIRRHHLGALIVQRLAPWGCGPCKLILTVHDLTPLKFPRDYRGLTNRLVRLLTRDSVRRAHLILTPTRTVADEVKGRFGLERTPIHAYYNGVDTESFSPETCGSPDPVLAALGLKTPYVFSSGAIEARKNLETVYEAFARLPDDTPAELVVAGKVRDPSYAEALERRARALGIAPRVRRLGFVDEATLTALYRHAACFVTASRDEGFNIPPLEAMACGIPVICSDIPVHRELFDGHAIFFAPDAPAALAVAMARLLAPSDLQRELREGGLALTQQFSWRRAGERIVAALREVLEA
ncbi:MAG: glycosyltransferase family 1 protein [Betaproteobacteria bacterium]|nr:glycosyltransferase family 1 protein [Betaproteobacteria bacterium]